MNRIMLSDCQTTVSYEYLKIQAMGDGYCGINSVAIALFVMLSTESDYLKYCRPGLYTHSKFKDDLLKGLEIFQEKLSDPQNPSRYLEQKKALKRTKDWQSFSRWLKKYYPISLTSIEDMQYLLRLPLIGLTNELYVALIESSYCSQAEMDLQGHGWLYEIFREHPEQREEIRLNLEHEVAMNCDDPDNAMLLRDDIVLNPQELTQNAQLIESRRKKEKQHYRMIQEDHRFSGLNALFQEQSLEDTDHHVNEAGDQNLEAVQPLLAVNLKQMQLFNEAMNQNRLPEQVPYEYWYSQGMIRMLSNCLFQSAQNGEAYFSPGSVIPSTGNLQDLTNWTNWFFNPRSHWDFVCQIGYKKVDHQSLETPLQEMPGQSSQFVALIESLSRKKLTQRSRKKNQERICLREKRQDSQKNESEEAIAVIKELFLLTATIIGSILLIFALMMTAVFIGMWLLRTATFAMQYLGNQFSFSVVSSWLQRATSFSLNGFTQYLLKTPLQKVPTVLLDVPSKLMILSGAYLASDENSYTISNRKKI